MVKCSRIITAVAVMIALSVTGAKAQYIAGNAYNPYTMYGLGEMFAAGDAASKAMGGLGIASRYSIVPNVQNPAALSAMPEKSVLFSLGIQANNNYLSRAGLSTSHNSLMLANVNMQFRVAKGIGFGMSLSPYTSVGYRVRAQEDDPYVITNIGDVSYYYTGSGGSSQFKAGFGFAINKNISLGINYVYYLGNVTREFNSSINPYVTPSDYRTIYDRRDVLVNQSSFELGAQYTFKVSRKGTQMTVGAVFQPHLRGKAPVDQYVESYLGSEVDTVKYAAYDTPLRFPMKIGGGVMIGNTKFKIGVDYVYHSYKDVLPEFINPQKVSTGSSHDLKLGAEYIPNRFDIRSPMKRVSYRAGARWSRSYLVYDGNDIDEVALTLGVGIPMVKGNLSQVNVGVEVGTSGLRSDQIHNTFFRIYGGVNLYNANEWFRRRMFR